MQIPDALWGFLGIVVGALLNAWFNRHKSAAERENLNAISEQIRTDTKLKQTQFENALMHQIKDLQDKFQAQQEEYENAEKSRRQELNRIHKEREEQKAENSELRALNSALNARAIQKQQEYNSLMEKLIARETENKGLHIIISELNEKIDRLTEQLETVKTDTGKLQRVTAELQEAK